MSAPLPVSKSKEALIEGQHVPALSRGHVVSLPTRHIDMDGELLHADSLLASRYQLCTEVGRGGEGVVFRAFDWAQSHMPIAVKRRHCNNAEEIQEAMQEAAMLARVSWSSSSAAAKHFPRFLDSFLCDHVDAGQRMFSFHIMQEMIAGGDLLTKLHSTSDANSALPLARWCSELCDAVVQLHKLHILHRDIKLENILLRADADMTLVLCDFGCATTSHCRSATANSVVGSTFYLAPELFNAPRGSVRPSRAADAWAVGITMLEIGSGHPQRHAGGVSLGEVASAALEATDSSEAARLWQMLLTSRLNELQPQARVHRDRIRELLQSDPSTRLDLTKAVKTERRRSERRDRGDATLRPNVETESESFLSWVRKRAYATAAMIDVLQSNGVDSVDALYAFMEELLVSPLAESEMVALLRRLFEDAKDRTILDLQTSKRSSSKSVSLSASFRLNKVNFK
jgi:serine/threonine protein kinase